MRCTAWLVNAYMLLVPAQNRAECTLHVMGGRFGQLGHGTNSTPPLSLAELGPTAAEKHFVVLLETFVAVSAGTEHSLVLAASAAVYR